MPKYQPKPFERAAQVRITLEMYCQHGEAALRGKSLDAFIKEDVTPAFENLMDVRNIINGLSNMDREVTETALDYLDWSKVTEAVARDR